MKGNAHNLRGHNFIAWTTGFLMLASLYAIFLYAPLERHMLEVQKIFYIHVGAAWNAFFAFFIVFIASIIYLKTRNLKYDVLAAASAEVGFLFTTIVLLTGPIWARHSWNAWWTWEPRLTTTLILWFIYFAYFLVRSGVAEKARRAVLSAVFGIIGFLDVPIIYISVRWWGSHPTIDTTGGGLHPMMLHALIVTVLAFAFLYGYLCQKAIALENTRQELQEIKEKLRESI